MASPPRAKGPMR